MSKKIGLNRGLEQILGDYGKEISNKNSQAAISEISCSEIKPGQYQPRRRFDEHILSELAESIAKYGVLQPIVIRPIEAQNQIKYEIIAGERRFKAAQQCGLSKIPCVIKNYDDEQAIAVSLIENLQRSDLTPIEVAEGFQQLINKFNFTHEQIGNLLGIARSNITNTLRLLKLVDVVKNALEEGKIDKGHARAIAGLSEEQQVLVLNEILARNLTVQQTEARVNNLNSLKRINNSKSVPIKNLDILHLETQVSDYLGYDININHKNNGSGKIVLKYRNLDELDGILEKWGYKTNHN